MTGDDEADLPTGPGKPATIWIQAVLCERCDGILISERSKKRRMGPTCWCKARLGTVMQQREKAGQTDMFGGHGPREGKGNAGK